jgi:hypothetical protein
MDLSLAGDDCTEVRRPLLRTGLARCHPKRMAAYAFCQLAPTALKRHLWMVLDGAHVANPIFREGCSITSLVTGAAITFTLINCAPARIWCENK